LVEVVHASSKGSDEICAAILGTPPGRREAGLVFGPVVADVARKVVEAQQAAEWRWSVTDPDTGQVLYDGTTRRRPTSALRRRVQARDQTCVFPGCRMPAVDCDLDHIKRWADGGATTQRNLAPACRRDNLLKEQHHWTYQRLPNGDYQWTTKLGHTYTTNRKPP
jgi:5-methylcytosine-specific restriction endonuclease McrA